MPLHHVPSGSTRSPEPLRKQLGLPEVIRRLRRDANLTQRQLAQQPSVALDRIREYERSERIAEGLGGAAS